MLDRCSMHMAYRAVATNTGQFFARLMRSFNRRHDLSVTFSAGLFCDAIVTSSDLDWIGERSSREIK
jgi:hypothetical protein